MNQGLKYGYASAWSIVIIQMRLEFTIPEIVAQNPPVSPFPSPIVTRGLSGASVWAPLQSVKIREKPGVNCVWGGSLLRRLLLGKLIIF